jgi:hypothetical protein
MGVATTKLERSEVIGEGDNQIRRRRAKKRRREEIREKLVTRRNLRRISMEYQAEVRERERGKRG